MGGGGGGGGHLLQVLQAVVSQGEDLKAVQPFHAIQSADPVMCQTQVTQFMQGGHPFDDLNVIEGQICNRTQSRSTWPSLST